MLIRFLNKKNKVLYLAALLILLIAMALPTSNVLANRQANNLYGAAAQDVTNNPPGVCVFDLDDTLIADASNKAEDLLPGARSAVKECVAAGYGIAFSTARIDQFDATPGNNVPILFTTAAVAKRAPGEQGELSDAYYKKIVENNVVGSYLGVKPTAEYKVKGDTSNVVVKKKYNPLYISFSKYYAKMVDENGVEYRATLYNKGDAMNRLMRTFYGYGVGEADETDYGNAYVREKKKPKLNKHDIYNLSGCLVLFDDGQSNIDDVTAFNARHGTNFQAITWPDNRKDHEKERARGVTRSDVLAGIDLVRKNCAK